MSVDELIGKIPTKTNHRYFKAGDVLRWVPRYVNEERVTERGLAIVVSTNGPIFEAYWVGSKEVSEHDARAPQSFILQDIAPLPEVVEIINKMRDKNESGNTSQV